MSEYNFKYTRTGERLSGNYTIRPSLLDDGSIVVSQADREEFIVLPMDTKIDPDHPGYEKYVKWRDLMKNDYSLIAKALVVCKNRCEHDDDYAGLASPCTNPNCPIHAIWGKQPLHLIH